MRKMVFTILGSALLASSMVQVASAAEHHHKARAAVRATAPATAPLDANAYAAPVYQEPQLRVLLQRRIFGARRPLTTGY